jgi:hypothetical protein
MRLDLGDRVLLAAILTLVALSAWSWGPEVHQRTPAAAVNVAQVGAP